MRPDMKEPGTSLLTLKCDQLLSTFAFNLNLRRYKKGTFKPLTAGLYALTAKHIASGLSVLDNFTVTVAPGAADAAKVVVSGAGVTGGVAGDAHALTLTVRDAYNNLVGPGLHTPYTPPIHPLYTPYTPPIHPLCTPYTPPIHPPYTPHAHSLPHYRPLDAT